MTKKQKNLLSRILAAAVLFMLFLFVLLFGLLQQFAAFFATIYNELMFRR